MKNIKKYVNDNKYRITIKENMIDIENYNDIGNISDDEMMIYLNNKIVKISGSKLKITKLLNNEILILGKYNTICFEGLNE